MADESPGPSSSIQLVPGGENNKFKLMYYMSKNKRQ